MIIGLVGNKKDKDIFADLLVEEFNFAKLSVKETIDVVLEQYNNWDIIIPDISLQEDSKWIKGQGGQVIFIENKNDPHLDKDDELIDGTITNNFRNEEDFKEDLRIIVSSLLL